MVGGDTDTNTWNTESGTKAWNSNTWDTANNDNTSLEVVPFVTPNPQPQQQAAQGGYTNQNNNLHDEDAIIMYDEDKYHGIAYGTGNKV